MCTAGMLYGYLASKFAFNPGWTIFSQGGPILDAKTDPARPKLVTKLVQFDRFLPGPIFSMTGHCVLPRHNSPSQTLKLLHLGISLYNGATNE